MLLVLLPGSMVLPQGAVLLAQIGATIGTAASGIAAGSGNGSAASG